jgi:hypothetical protein
VYVFKLRTIPLTVLAYEGPGSRAYLAMMETMGFRPSSIIGMVSSHGEVAGNGKRVGRLLPGFLRSKYAKRVQEIRRMYWPRQIRKLHPDLYEAIANGLSSEIDEPRQMLDKITGAFRLEDYSDDVSYVMVRNYRDPSLLQIVKNVSSNPILFTGGGILPSSLIAAAPRIVHVHPGYLPHVKGADGLLWSTLVRFRPGAACFYMNKGIDTGAIIETMDLSPLTFEISESARSDDQTLYRSLFSFYDPLIRAKVFSEVLALYHGQLPDNGASQSSNEGTTYHFMHADIRARALRKIFVSP